MLEVTDKDIAELKDDDLRTLVALLCEATLRVHSLPASAVTWGGDQDAPDGGIDVRVDLSSDTTIRGFVPRPATGFQVKKPGMSPAAITGEMRPGGVLRPVINELAESGGAYIIISSTGSVSDKALRERRTAMKNAVAGIPNADRLFVDFYDRRRLATWVGDHPGLVPWVRRKAGRPIQGWHSYSAWTVSPNGLDNEYLTDGKTRLYHSSRGDHASSAVDGINRIRIILRESGQSVRFVGLSGVGKTRFVQALFDDRVGEQALDPALAFYTDIADDPEPQPVGLISHLVATRIRAILVVDNCPPDLHRRLTDLMSRAG